MMYARMMAILLLGLAVSTPATAQHDAPPPAPQESPDHPSMHMFPLPGGWHAMAMAHVYPSLTAGAPFGEGPLRRTELRLPHAAAMANLESPDARWVLRLMPNFEGATLPSGEATFGGWGEGFIDKRHPHTLVHEAMLSFNWWGAPGGGLSVSAGRGFAPYGTDDPMYRPALKYPTNHHLSQILERWGASAAYLSDAGWSLEAGLFDGNEPGEWTDMSNFEDPTNSWSARATHRFGRESGGMRAWEASVSMGQVSETHGDASGLERTDLYNAALRHSGMHDFGHLYALAEASMSRPEDEGSEGYRSLLAEAQLTRGAHLPFVRIEHATRPEYGREGEGGDPFFRYDHDDHAIGASRWLIATAGYSHRTGLPLDARPFVEMQHHRVSRERGPERVAPESLFGSDAFWSVTVGARLFLGGGPMRMGTYGVLDPMTAGMRDEGMEHDTMDGTMDHDR